MTLADYAHAKLGPVPVPVVGLVVVGGGLYYAARLRKGPAAGVSSDTDPAADDAPGQTQPVFTAKPNPDAPSAPTVEVSNDAWSASAIAWLIAGSHPVTDSTNAIVKYLAGDNLSYTEGQLRDLAVAHFGTPPDPVGVIGSVGANDSSPTKQGVPPTTHTVKGSRDNTLAELALLYYNSGTVDALTLLKAANPGRSNNSPIPVGTAVKVPRFVTPKYEKATSTMRTQYQFAARNATTAAVIEGLNPGLRWPVAVGTRVRVG